MEKPTDDVINYLNFLVRTYDAVTKTITSTKNRWHALNKEGDSKFDDIIMEMESHKGKIKRKIGHLLEYWPLWTRWLSKVPGIGEWMGGSLILLYYYRFTPICPECSSDLVKKDKTFWCPKCEKTAKGDGILTHRIDDRDFPRISNWWSFMGRGADENGRMPKRKAGQQSNWNSKGRVLTYQIGDSFIKQPASHSYRQFYDGKKAKKEKSHTEATKNYRHCMSRHETAKLFLAHFLVVARTIDGKPVTQPYVSLLGQHNTIEPFYWDEAKSHQEFETQDSHASQALCEPHEGRASHDCAEIYT